MVATMRSAGIGLRLPHLAEVVATTPQVGWLEIHPENFLANPHAAQLLDEIARGYSVSVHTVGVSVGSATGLDRAHLARVRALVDRIRPAYVSGHLAWSSLGSTYLNDLLPLPYDAESLAVVAAHVAEVQDALGRQYLIENPSSYVGFRGSAMTEPEFLSALVDRTGCGVLCDVSNVYLSAHNMRFDAKRYIDELPAAAVQELHLGGFSVEDDGANPGRLLLVDTHDTAIDPGTWALYEHACERFSHAATLIEWDADVPSLETLVAEAMHADEIAAVAREGARRGAR